MWRRKDGDHAADTTANGSKPSPLDARVEESGVRLNGSSFISRGETHSRGWVDGALSAPHGVDLMVPRLLPSEGLALGVGGLVSPVAACGSSGTNLGDKYDENTNWPGKNTAARGPMKMSGEGGGQQQGQEDGGAERHRSSEHGTSRYKDLGYTGGRDDRDVGGGLCTGGQSIHNGQQQQHRAPSSRDSDSNSNHITHDLQYAQYHRLLPTPAGGASGQGTPLRTPSERSSVDGFDSRSALSAGNVATPAPAASLSGLGGSGVDTRSNRNAASSPPLEMSPRSSLAGGNGGSRPKGGARTSSPSIGSPRSLSPGRRGAGVGEGNASAGGGILGSGSPVKKAGRRSNDTHTAGRKSVEGQGGVSHNFKVVIRVRPPLPREVEGERMFQNIVSVDRDEHVITISENLNAVFDEDGTVASAGGPYNTQAFTFDHVYDVSASQRKVYDTTAMEVVDSSLQGYNATVFAYGQTGTGKTFTMEGFKRGASAEDRGIIPRAIEQVFAHIQRNASPRMRFLVRASYLQIYNEQISDLLKPERNNLTIREDRKRGVFVEGLSEWVVRTPGEIYGLMERGGQLRATGATRMNDTSSRSHAVFIIIVEQSETSYTNERGEEVSPEALRQLFRKTGSHEREALLRNLEKDARQTFKVGKLNLVDLAGSERVRLSGATGQRLQESKKINQSLSALGNVISALTDHRGRQHIPYRDSKLTRILEDSLGGNCKTTMMAMISPALESMVETLSTVKFANRAKNIKNQPVVNEDFDQKSLLRKYERELKRLRAELEERSRNLVDKRQLLYVEGERRRAEADKMAAIRALEERSLEFQREKEEKRLLEGRIATLTGQMIGRGRRADGGAGGAEYADRLAELEKERNTIEMEKEQVERYKQLLMKQRDIMIALTQRLNERDDAICGLNDDLDANEAHQELLEDALDIRTQQLFRLQKALVLHNGGGGGEGVEGDIDQQGMPQTIGGWAPPTTTASMTGTTSFSPLSLSPRSTLRQQQQPQRPSTAPLPFTSTASLDIADPYNGKVPSTPDRGHGAGHVSFERKRRPPNSVNESSRVAATKSHISRLTSSSSSKRGEFAGLEAEITADSGERNEASLLHGVEEKSLITFRRFKPHALMQPTLFSTADTGSGVGVSLHDTGVLAGGEQDEQEGGHGGGGGGSSGSGGGRRKDMRSPGGTGTLLNAWEKIEELEGLVESSRSHNERLLEDLEEVQTDKVSMEYLLREKLERLVQSEIEARVARMHQDGGVDEILRRQLDGLRVEAEARARSEAVLREEIKRLKRSISSSSQQEPGGKDESPTRPVEVRHELQSLQNENKQPRNADALVKVSYAGKDREEALSTRSQVQLGVHGGNVESPEEEDESERGRNVGRGTEGVAAGGRVDSALQNRCEALLGERKAMQTIMEQKVRVLVDNVSDSARAVLDLVTAAEAVDGDVPRFSTLASPSGAEAAARVGPDPGSVVDGMGKENEKYKNSAVNGEPRRSPTARDIASKALTKDLGQLRRLVQAAITALRNAEIEDQQRTAGTDATDTCTGRAGATAVVGRKIPDAVLSPNVLRSPVTAETPREAHSASATTRSSARPITTENSEGASSPKVGKDNAVSRKVRRNTIDTGAGISDAAAAHHGRGGAGKTCVGSAGGITIGSSMATSKSSSFAHPDSTDTCLGVHVDVKRENGGNR